jgi:RNA polymerase sigma factor (sigma-70 family)
MGDTMPTDTDLLQAYVETDDQAAFATLIGRYLRQVYAVAQLRTGSHELSEEVTQRVFCDLARKSSVLRFHPRLEGWLFKTTRYLAIDSLRKRCREQRLSSQLLSMADHTAQDENIPWEKLRPLLDSALDSLKPRDREALLLRHFEGLSYAELGKRLGLSENAARMRVDRSLEQLRSRMASRGLKSTSAALALALGTSALAGIPDNLHSSVLQVVLGAGKAPGMATALLAMIKLKSVLLTGAIGTVLTLGTYAYVESQSAPPADKPPTAAQAPSQLKDQGQSRSALEIKIAELEAKLPPKQAVGSAAPVDERTAYNQKHNINTSLPWVNAGQATPLDAALTFAWASVSGEVDILSKVIHFDGNGRAKAQAILDQMPESVRAEYPTPEHLIALCVAADARDHQPPPADLMRKMGIHYLSEDRVCGVTPEGKIDSSRVFIKVDGVWKWCWPEQAVEPFMRFQLKMK